MNRAFLSVFLAALVSTGLAQPPASELRKPPPDAHALPYRERLETLIKARYPRLLTEKVGGTATVKVLLNADGTLAATDLEVSQKPEPPLTASALQFARFGIGAGELKYVGIARLQLASNSVLVVFGAKNSTSLDHALVERLFPRALSKGVPAGHALWILFDHEGREVAKGEEAVDATSLRAKLEARYVGIRTSDLTVTRVPAAPAALQLYCVWLTANSPPPALR